MTAKRKKAAEPEAPEVEAQPASEQPEVEAQPASEQYTVAAGCSLSVTYKGILKEGAEVKPEYVSGGVDALKALAKKGLLVEPAAAS